MVFGRKIQRTAVKIESTRPRASEPFLSANDMYDAETPIAYWDEDLSIEYEDLDE
jgi:hypothetical protein